MNEQQLQLNSLVRSIDDKLFELDKMTSPNNIINDELVTSIILKIDRLIQDYRDAISLYHQNDTFIYQHNINVLHIKQFYKTLLRRVNK